MDVDSPVPCLLLVKKNQRKSLGFGGHVLLLVIVSVSM